MTKEEKEQVFDYMINQNEKSYNFLKAIEELQELSLILTQDMSKGVHEEKIIEEIGDVKFRLKVLESYFDPEKIKQRINKKLAKNLNYIKQNKYKNV